MAQASETSTQKNQQQKNPDNSGMLRSLPLHFLKKWSWRWAGTATCCKFPWTNRFWAAPGWIDLPAILQLIRALLILMVLAQHCWSEWFKDTTIRSSVFSNLISSSETLRASSCKMLSAGMEEKRKVIGNGGQTPVFYKKYLSLWG